MTDLTREQRGALRTAISAARQEAEAAAADALRRLGVAEAEAPAHLDAEKRKQRNRLRAHARALGDARAANGTQAITRLTEQAAYVQWHRLLFARFLIERKLLREETGAPLSLNDCREIAFGEGVGADEWSVAAGFVAAMLPGVFPADDPVESLVLAPEHSRTLRQRLLGIDAAIFQADDSLGWTYQFWREAEKKAVNEAQVKIGAAELPAVTQLFTEPYMVRFLLHNTLGAWWAGKCLATAPALARGAADEAALRAACALPGYAWNYLRFVKSQDGTWRPAAGTFSGWPTKAKALAVLDPCCGSGHFLTEALSALAALRRAEEGLSSGEAVAAVLRDNLAGLEIDGRCVQIAAFNLALTGWRIGGPGTALPTPNVAWVGAPPPLPKTEFAALANGDAELRRGLEALHDLFRQAPLLGSLIEPVGGDLADPRRVARIEDSIATLVERMRGAEPERAEGVVAARGMADAAAILSRRWSLLITNVPFLGERRQNSQMKSEIGRRFAAAKADLSTTMLDRLRNLAEPACTVATVMPQSWMLQPSYQDLRRNILREDELNIIASLGPRAFETISGERVDVALCATSRSVSSDRHRFSSVNATAGRDSEAKAALLLEAPVTSQSQASQLGNPGQRIMLVALAGSTKKTLGDFAVTYQGVKSGDDERFVRYFWEMEAQRDGWRNMQTTVEKSLLYGGAMLQLWWGLDGSHLIRRREEGQRMAAQRRAVSVSQMSSLPSCILSAEVFDSNVSPIFVENESLIPAIYEFIISPEFYAAKQALETGMKANNGTLLQIPFDLPRWQSIAERKYPSGLPEPYSDDPTQWLFHGDPRHAPPGTELHVALARLAGYRWPAETDATMRLSTEARARIAEAAALPPADADGLVPLNPLLGGRGLADRLRAWCAAAWGKAWTAETEAALIAAACERARDKPPRSLTLDAWLRTHAARQHAKLFHDRPFLWWITDGRSDGFMAVVHYHRLTRDALSRLAFHVLGDHLARLGDDPRAEAARILQRKLEQIIEGDAPYDIFVRWKPLHEQPLGWDPDLDDGVRLNIRPFIEAGVLAHVPNGVHYRTDRGKDVASAPWYSVFNGERRNDHHTTLAEKRAARAARQDGRR
ncbi:BREX-1 system adenine-specific DNA-methyltransferase PglX [Roseicella aerolata]|uniref:site-specific DNA-methyltransferase (adenine-specific) n=1 Tax=Roseicella aerolata TaxID=2883479 RepID=A0A9X1IGN2_9PROT|nr:BREX-1 system adenine-specific DNA-methyltransferase PglX [Roseicella aerolata]MCB4823814.1 BREX-1 system adenine-specific DNA-methyltransferase PglX [Roseicella aerolata]